MAASGFIDILRSNEHTILLMSLSLCPVGWITAYNTNCERLGYIFSNCKKLRHGIKRFASIVLVEPRHNYPSSIIGELLANFNKVCLEELTLINPNNLSLPGKVHDFRSIGNGM